MLTRNELVYDKVTKTTNLIFEVGFEKGLHFWLHIDKNDKMPSTKNHDFYYFFLKALLPLFKVLTVK